MKYFYILLFIVMLPLIAPAQTGKGKITGKITDADTKQPVDYATISLFVQGSAKPLTGTTTDQKGNFTLTGIANGEYHITVAFIGYKPYNLEHIKISDSKSSVNTGTILLAPATKQLNEVNVTAKVPTVENKIDKMVYNAANDITSQGGAALDVLRKVPQVTVDIDGNVELQGQPGIRFLINGKPSSIFGSSVADALASIPASQIKSIEVITSPGAKYDAEGLGGIINIILKDNRVRGINGNVNLSAGTRIRNGSANLNIRNGNFGISVFGSSNQQVNTRTMNLNDRTAVTSAGLINRLVQDGYSDFERKSYETGISFDWSPSKHDNFTGSFGYDRFTNYTNTLTDQQQYLQGSNTVFSQRASVSNFRANTIDVNFNYRKTFAKDGQELNFLYTLGSGNNHSSYSQAQTLRGAAEPFAGSASDNPGTDRETNIALDYTHPVGKDLVIETGAKTVLQTINSSAAVNTLKPATGLYTFDPTQSYHLLYDRKVYAAYLSATFKLFNFFDAKAGVRYEHTDTKVDFPGTAIPAYNLWVPSAVFSHKISPSQSVKLSYTKRVERPEYREVNPFLNLSDPYNITTGNPQLKPEIGDVFELGYSRSFEAGGNIYIAAFSRHNSNDVKPYTNFYPEFLVGDSVYRNVSVTNRQNIGFEQNTGINISASVPFGKKFNLRTNTSVTNRYVVNKVYGGSSNAVVVKTNLNASYQLSNNFVAEAFGSFNSASNNIQGRVPQFITYNLALRKQFLKDNKASVGFTTTNPFAKYVDQVTTITQAATTSGQPYNSYSLRRIPYQSFGVSLSYRFGKLDFKKVKEQDNLAKPIDN